MYVYMCEEEFDGDKIDKGRGREKLDSSRVLWGIIQYSMENCGKGGGF